MSNETDVIVVFSVQQFKRDTDVYKKAGKTYTKKYVIIGGKPVQYTDIVDSRDKIKFVDSKELITGKKSEMKFTEK